MDCKALDSVKVSCGGKSEAARESRAQPGPRVYQCFTKTLDIITFLAKDPQCFTTNPHRNTEAAGFVTALCGACSLKAKSVVRVCCEHFVGGDVQRIDSHFDSSSREASG